MRYMWICNPAMSSDFILKMFGDQGLTVAMRLFTTRNRQCWVFITDYEDWQFAQEWELNDTGSDHFSITACNKQYVVNESTRTYLGALAEVDISEARDWAREDDDNWFLRDSITSKCWMPVHRNPNKLIPTGDAGYCRHCGNTSAQTPGNRYRAVYRPWPLHVDA